MSTITNILIAYDGSKSADSAIDDLRNAGLEASGVNATVISVAEVWLPPETMSDADLPTEGMRSHLDANLKTFENVKDSNARAVERVRNLFPAWNVQAFVTSGSAAWEILIKAGEMKAELIVIGAQGLSAVDRILIGSVSSKVVNEAPCSVHVARGRVEVDGSAPRIVIAFDGSEGSDAAVDAVLARKWPAATEVRLVVANDGASRFDAEDDGFKAVVTSVIDRLTASGLKAQKSIIAGTPKQVIIKEVEAFSADCIFIGSAGHSSRLSQMLLGTVSSAVVTRAHCSVEVVKAKKS